jgi:hypothetical protein
MRERNHLEDLGLRGRIILKRDLKLDEGIDWIDLALDNGGWRSVTNAVMNHRVP